MSLSTGKFRLNITALNVISEHSRYKVWIKANGGRFSILCCSGRLLIVIEMPLLYGGNVLRAHIARFSDNDIPEHSGVLIYSQNDEPLVRDLGMKLYRLKANISL